jgi:hypothetical protein
MNRCKKEAARLTARFPNAISPEHILLSSWACDMDGKPHVNPGLGVVFEYESQQKFLKT